MSSFEIEKIIKEAFTDLLSRYSSNVPEGLKDLDSSRYYKIPMKLKSMMREGRSPSLDGKDLQQLVEWKLKHGTFRPKLLQLVQSNSNEDIQDITTNAFKLLAEDGEGNTASLSSAIKVMTGLKGIGPATASLTLSCFAPDTIPFFSDELFRWCMWSETGSPSGWRRTIKYNVKEYGQVVERLAKLRQRLGVSALDAERVAWVLGKEGENIGGEVGKHAVENNDVKERDTSDRRSSRVSENNTTSSKNDGKRKIGGLIGPTEGARKSARLRK